MINEDLTVPIEPQRSWLLDNEFGGHGGASGQGLPDLIVADIRYQEDSETVSVRVVNRGDVAGPFELSLVGAVEVGRQTSPGMAAGEFVNFEFTGLSASALEGGVLAHVDATALVSECLEDNNQAQATFIQLEATDQAGASDQQSFLLSVKNTNQPPVVTSQPPASIQAGFEYRYLVAASDPDSGDILRFTVTDPPKGLKIDAVNGELTWTPNKEHRNTVRFKVVVYDLAGASGTQQVNVEVLPNLPPVFVSTPLSRAVGGFEYRYQAEAIDPEGGTIRYDLPLKPEGMTIDPVSGLITWVPPYWADRNGTIRVRAFDELDQHTIQFITITLRSQNDEPLIESTPATNVLLGDTYAYPVLAHDADGDPLTYRLTVAPNGMTIDAIGGQIDWLPDTHGNYQVTIEVERPCRGV